MNHPVTSSSLVACLFVWALGGASPVPAVQESASRTGDVAGRIVDSGGRPASGVSVVLSETGTRTRTGVEGRFRFDGVEVGLRTLVLVHASHGTDTIRVPVAQDQTTEATLRYSADGQLSIDIRMGGLPISTGGVVATSDTRSGESRIVGRLLGETDDRPVPSADVELVEASRRTVSTDRGRFTFDSLAAGTYTVKVHHVRYGDPTAEVKVPEDRTVDVEIGLTPEAVEVEPLRVTVDATVRLPALEAAGYYERKEWQQKLGLGEFLEGEEIDQRGSRLSQAIATLPSLNSWSRQRVRGVVYFRRHRRGGGACLPAVYLDGHKVVGSNAGLTGWVDKVGPRGIDALANLEEIAAIEAYDGPASAPGQFHGTSACGALVIWTK